ADATTTSAPASSLIQLASGAGDANRKYGVTGSAIGVAVIDSGRASHLDFSSQTSAGVNLVPLGSTNATTSTNDRYGHGTLVAGIVAGKGTISQRYGFNYAGIAP